MTSQGRRGWAVWLVGLPGSGKSALARGLHQELAERGLDVVWLQMDERRKAYFPKPTYSAEEREKAYAMFVDEAAALVAQGRGVLMDGTAYQLAMRRAARQRIPRFAEICVTCPIEEAMRREASRPEGLVMAGLYEKALERKRTGRGFAGLGEVIGVDVPFELDPEAELNIDNTELKKEQTRAIALAFLEKWLDL
ncbi:MAG: adenylyl-sulfate kinase [Desulfovibrionaceae bacterium]|nr:adenylyl-sulfate kinase [Desulfovibrionaceae bacterium]